MRRAVSVSELLNTRFKTIDIAEDFHKLMGKPEAAGAWIVYGESGNGKTRFSLQLAKELSRHTRVAYNTIEEGVKLSFQKAIEASNLHPVAQNFIIYPGDDLTQLKRRLKRRRSPNVIIIDSLQYFVQGDENSDKNITKFQYKELLSDFPKKLFIFISHAQKNSPKGELAKSIKFDADVKIKVEGYKAFAISRFGGGEAYTIWEEGARKYWEL